MWRKEDVVDHLREKQANSGMTLRAFASSINCSPALLSKVLHGKREPGPKLLEGLGLERTIVKTVEYQPKKWRNKDE
jgi:transcriptional regulator with XRE-family HTH domain